MPKLVFRAGVGDVDNYPDLPFKAAPKLRGMHPNGYFDPKPWYEQQGIADTRFVEVIEVVEHEDGSMFAYLTQRETLTEAEYEQRRTEKGANASRLRVFPDEPKLTHSFTMHYPVTSIELLLDQFVQPVKESV